MNTTGTVWTAADSAARNGAAGRARLLDASAEHELLLAWKLNRDSAAGRALVESHLPLAAAIAARYRGLGVPFEDLLSEATLGLYRALEKFEFKGARFATYAALWARSYVCAHVTSARWSRLQNDSRRDDAGDTGDVLDRLASSAPCAETLLVQHETVSRVRRALRRTWPRLNERERAIVEHRMLDDKTTLRDLGARLGLSAERIRQLETRVKRQMLRELSRESLDAARWPALDRTQKGKK
jgi:RNA polymerase sigma factor (sigma-70 family)